MKKTIIGTALGFLIGGTAIGASIGAIVMKKHIFHTMRNYINSDGFQKEMNKAADDIIGSMISDK